GGAVRRNPRSLANDDFADEIVQEKTLAEPRIGRCPDLLGAERLHQVSDQLIDRSALLRAGGEVEAAQGCGGVIAARLEDEVQEVMDRLLEPGHLGGKTEQQNAGVGRRLVLQAIERLLAQ